MFKTNLASLVVLSFISCSSAWIFNNVDFCQLITNIDDTENDLCPENFKLLKLKMIYPGTKWCGAGNISDGYDDLGSASETDMCCREHDLCADHIPAGESKHNLTNDAVYTRLNCQCDENFRNCLRAVRSQTSAIIGTFYFNTLRTKCFRKDYPVIRCKKKGGWLNTKCTAYSYDFNGEQRYQWFDLPNY